MRDASDGTVEALGKIVAAIQKRFGQKVRILVTTPYPYVVVRNVSNVDTPYRQLLLSAY